MTLADSRSDPYAIVRDMPLARTVGRSGDNCVDPRPTGPGARSPVPATRATTAEMAASFTCSRPAAATSSTPALRSASSRVAARSSWRTRPAMRATTSRNSSADATISTSRSGSSNAWHEPDRRARSGTHPRAARDAAGSGEPAPRAQVPRACASTGGARPRPRAGSRRSSRRRSSAGGCTCP